MRRCPTIFTVLALLLAPLAACGGDGDGNEAAQSEEETEASEGGSEAEASESEPSGSADASEPEASESEQGGPEGSGTPGGEVSAEAYADGVCTSINGWYESIESSSQDLVEEAGSLSADPANGKEIVLRFLDNTIGLTDTLVTDLEAAGVPETPTGQETADKLVSGIGDVRALFSQARDDTAALPSDDDEAIVSGLQDIGMTLQESATTVGASFEEVLSSVDDPQLAEAFEATPSCSVLTAPTG